MNPLPRILLAAPKSGSGKTMITCGIIELWKRQGKKVASFKCGPDYIDPMFHRQVLGIESGNLDTYFTEDTVTRYLLRKRAKEADIAVIEGVMGYYDGLSGTSERASTYEVAKVTATPVILVVDAKGASVSLAAVIKGIIDYKEDSGICGILLNRVSAGYYERIRKVIESACGIPVVGYLPELKDLEIPSRHLGLIAPEEMTAFEEWIKRIADTMESTVDMDRLLEIANAASKKDEETDAMAESEDWEDTQKRGNSQEEFLPHMKGTVRLAVARDAAFSFCYAENIELLQEMGAELVYFSPIADSELPVQTDGLILPGGYPENYAKELEQNERMRNSIKSACENGLPCLAECGGFLYLGETLEGSDGGHYNMAGVLPGKGFRTERLARFGYMQAGSKYAGLVGEKGMVLKGHEFHYWDSTENGNAFLAGKPVSGVATDSKQTETGKGPERIRLNKGSGFREEDFVERQYTCMVHTNTMLAGFPHFYYYSNPQAIYQFLLKCQSYRAGRLAKAHWDAIAKPIDSLGLLEDYIVKISRITGSAEPYALDRRALAIFCADHGVVEEGVTQTGQEVTGIVSENFAKGCSTVNILAEKAGTDVYAIDVGMNTDTYPEKRLVMGHVIDRKVMRGSRNLAKEAAMTIDECEQAIAVGRQVVRNLKEMDYKIIALGEMGIGNTTPTSALAAIFLKKSAEQVTGKGAGLSSEGIRKKCRVVEQAVKRVEEKGLQDPVAILAEVGGLEIAAMTGAFLGGMENRIPMVIDGAIATVAALTAYRIDPRVKDYLLASHVSEEPVGRMALEEMGLDAILHGRMCLGEGTGAVALFPLLDMATEVYRRMGSFEDYAIEAYERFEE